MVGALNLFVIACLLQGALCGEFKVIMPQTIKVPRGSCVTIPCSFDVLDQFVSKLESTCKALWKKDRVIVFDSSQSQTTGNNGQLKGDLTKKDCTTTLNNIQPVDNNEKYSFRLECKDVRYDFTEKISFLVTDDPLRPTLTPSTLRVKEGTSVSLKCSAPAPCLSHPPTLTWTPGLGDSQETLQENQDKTKVQTSVVSFTASHLHHGKTISCTATYNKQDESAESVVSTNLTADISYSPQKTTVSVRPPGPAQESKDVTLTCSSSANPPVKTFTWYRADGGQETLIGSGAVLNIKASKDNSLFFCKAQNDLGTGQSNISQIDVQFAPEILPSSNCTKAGAQLNCSCKTVGNPSPTLMWYLDGLSVNNSDNLTITYEPPNDTGLTSIITVNQPQERDLSTLLCRASNSVGSATHHFCAYCLEPEQSCRECQECSGGVTFPLFIITVGLLSAALFCALLFAIRARGTGRRTPKKTQSTGDTSPAVMSQSLTTENGNKVSCTLEEDIYVNTDMMKKPDTPNAHLGHQLVASKSSEKTNEENSDVVYSSVIWKSKEKKGECSGGRSLLGSSYLEEERCMEGGARTNYLSNAVEMGSLYGNTGKHVKKAVDTEYAEVHFRDTNVI